MFSEQVSFALAQDNAFVVGPVSVPVPESWGASAVPMGRSVTLVQFVRGLSSIAPNATKQERMRICFGAFDLNGDGFIDPPEMQTGFTSLYKSMADSGGALPSLALRCGPPNVCLLLHPHRENNDCQVLTVFSPDGRADLKLDPMEITVAVATLVNSPANQGGHLDVHAFTGALEEAGPPGTAIADCFRIDSGACLGASV